MDERTQELLKKLPGHRNGLIKPKSLTKIDSAKLHEAVQRAFGLHAKTGRGAFYGYWTERGELIIYPLEHHGRVG